MNERTEFENLLADYISALLTAERSPTKENNLAKMDAFHKVLTHVRYLEYTIHRIQQIVGEKK